MKKIILIFTFILTVCLARVMADDSIAPPAGAKQVDTQTVTMGGKAATGVFYETTATSDSVANHYRQVFTQQQFQSTKDTVENKKNYLRFEKDDMLYSIIITPEDSGTKFSVASTTKSGGTKNVSWDEMTNLLPKEDVAGADLDIVPRPPDSIRIGLRTIGNTAIIGYLTGKSMEFLENFYLKSMPDYGWDGGQDLAFKDQLAKLGSKADAAKNAISNTQITKDMPMMRMAQGAKVINFKGAKGSASVCLMPVNPGNSSDQRVVVTIKYIENKEVFDKK